MATETPATTTPAEPRKRSLGNAYLWMLILSFLFLTIGCGMLLLEWSNYWATGWFQLRPST